MSLENVVVFLNEVHETALAEQVLHVFGKHAKTFEQFDELSKDYFKIKNYDASIEYAEKALRIAPSGQHAYVTMHNLINVYNHNNEPEIAMEYIKASEMGREHDLERDFEKAYSLFLLNRKTEAAELLRSIYNSGVELTEEQRTKLEFNLGTYDLIDGNLQLGLRRFLLAGEAMGVHKTVIDPRLNIPRWNGVLKPGLKLLVVAEAGIGDEIINVRFMEDLKDYGIDACWLTMPNRDHLVTIYLANGIDAYSDIKLVPECFLKDCCYIPSMQLPIYLNCDYKDLWTGPYIKQLAPHYQAKWHPKVVGEKLTIGVRWQGNPAYDQDLHRSIPLKYLMEHIPLKSVEIFSIQKDTGLEELDEFPNIINLAYDLVTLQDLFSCIDHLDIVITSCTSVAHIAAAMGKQVCVLVPISCYYVWCNPTDQSPWYGSNVHMFYQKQPRCWQAPLQELNKYLMQNYYGFK